MHRFGTRCNLVIFFFMTPGTMMGIGEKKDRRPVEKYRPTCSTGDVLSNYTFSSGLRAGHFIEEEKAETMDDCIYRCCAKRECDVAFMLKKSCFLVQCYNKSSCQSRQARSPNFAPRLAYISRPDQYTDGKYLV